MASTESTPLLQKRDEGEDKTLFSAAHRVLLAGFLISIALTFTQVPVLYAFRSMECDEFYLRKRLVSDHDRCNRTEIDAATATQVSILGMSSTFAGVLNLFYAGWQIRQLGPRTALILQTAFPALRAAIQAVGVTMGARKGVIIVQCSQVVSLVGGVAGYLLVLNTIVSEVTAPAKRTAMFGMLQGSVMVGTAVGYLFGGIVSDTWGIRRPFEISTVLFLLSSLYAMVFIPYISPASISKKDQSGNQGIWHRIIGGLRVLLPRKSTSAAGKSQKEYGVTLLALGIFVGVLATGYAPILIQMYSTAALGFASSENGYLMAGNSLMRGIYLMFLFPKIIHFGRRWLSTSIPAPCIESAPDPSTITSIDTSDNKVTEVDNHTAGQEFDLLFLRWSLVMDGLITASTAFATQKWHIYLAGALLPLASGSAPASKGVITGMCAPHEQADALQAMTLVENIAMVSTLGVFGFIFSMFSNMGKAWMTFYCNAAVAMVAVLVLSFSWFPKQKLEQTNAKTGQDNSETCSTAEVDSR